MPTQVAEIKIFLASPGDVNKERDIVEKVVDELDRTIARRKGATIRLLRWETDTYPYFHLDGPQGAIDEQVSIADCDIFLCVFWQRLGSPTKKANSGTEHEFWAAYEAWKKTGSPIIMVYRSIASVDLRNIDLKQIERLNDFFNNDRIKSERWISEYGEIHQFESNIRSHLTGAIQDILDGNISPPIPSPVIDDEEMLQKLKFPKEDWKPITYNLLKKYYTELPISEALEYFDGREPIWKESISPSIARREIVYQLKNEITKKNTPPHVVLLRGLGGEGKSTVLQQTIYETVASEPHIYVLWHQQTSSPLELVIIEELAKTKHEWIIASDDADIIEKDLRKATKHIRENDIKNIRFLLATRDLDWRAVGGDAYGWPKSANFHTVPIGDLTQLDAKNIVEKWREYGDEGLGRLKGKNIEDAAQELFEKSRTEKNSPENSLLGAMLQVRTGKTLQEHLRPSLNRLNEIKLNNDISLRKAIAYISALHAYNIKILTPEILADVLSCSEENLHEQVIKPLGTEILSGKYILIRHVSIAEAIKNILNDDYEFTQITRKLLRSAHMLHRRNEFTGDINDWHKLPKIMFFDKNDKAMGIELSTEAVEAQLLSDSKYDPVTVTDLAYLYEKSNQNDQAVKVFRESYAKTKVDRAYYYKWGVAEGKSKHWMLGIWLAAISLSDGVYEKRHDPSRIYVSLSGLSSSFRFAYQKTKENTFLEACYVSAKFGLGNEPDDRATKNLLENLRFSEETSSTFDKKNALGTLLEGLKLAWMQRKEDLSYIIRFGEFPENLPTPGELQFIWLQSKLRI